jgi:hypothetical protein
MKPRPAPDTALGLAVASTLMIAAGCVSAERSWGQEASAPYLFSDVAEYVGLGGIEAKRVLWADLDGDSFPDCILDNRRVFLNRPARRWPGRTFVEFTRASRIDEWVGHEEPREPACLQAADVDNDGDIDLFAGQYGDFDRPVVENDEIVLDDHGEPVKAVADNGKRHEILLNDGSGRFTARQAALEPNPPATTITALFFDADQDGCVDLMIGNTYRAYGWSYECYPSPLYRGHGDGTFHNVTSETGWSTTAEPGARSSHRPVYGLSHCDFNNDAAQDILIAAYGRQWNVLLENRGRFQFADVADAVGFDGDEIRHGRYPPEIKEKHGREDEEPFRANGNTFDVACADYDNDGDIDLFVAEIAHAWAGESSDRSCLLVNRGPDHGYRFERRRDVGIDRYHDADRWNEGDLYAAWIDFDNDGLQDLLISSGDYPDGQFLRLFQQQPDHTFVEATGRSGFAWEGSGCLSLADYDRDGDVDILVTRSNFRMPRARSSARPPRVALFRNNVGNRNRFLSLRLVGLGSGAANRSAIGARVTVRSGDLVQTREVYGGLGHNTHRNEFPLTFGLADHKRVDVVEIHWPDRDKTVTCLNDVPANTFVTITQTSRGHRTRVGRAYR